MSPDFFENLRADPGDKGPKGRIQMKLCKSDEKAAKFVPPTRQVSRETLEKKASLVRSTC